MTDFREMNVLSSICLLLPFQTIANVSECKLCTYLLVYSWVLSKAVTSYILRQTFVHLGFYTSLQSQSLSALSQVCVLFNVFKASKYKYLAVVVVSENMTHTLEGKKTFQVHQSKQNEQQYLIDYNTIRYRYISQIKRFISSFLHYIENNFFDLVFCNAEDICEHVFR